MKKALAIIITLIMMISTIVPLGMTASAANKAPTVIPAIREWKGDSGKFEADSNTVLVNSNDVGAVSKVAGFFKEMLGLNLNIATTENGSNEIVFIKDAALESQVGKEGYTLEATTDKIVIKAATDTGLLYGGTTVVQSLSADGAFPCGSATDYPEYEVRSGMLDVGRAWMPLDHVEEITRYMAYFKLNEMHLHINDDGVNGYSGFRLESNIKGLASKDG
ncbi:MAG: family 20 glycosylhydrolase, partial [Clostridia bacterium]|nr:family 20 glycosylhydrolase [Clostridia bacterium]